MNEKETVLELLRAAIWNREPAVEVADWESVSRLAAKLTVLPLVADRILRLDPESLSGATREELEKVLRKAVYLNGVMQSVMVNAFAKMEDAGMEPVLLKGYYNATAYPEPYLRLSGDVDIFVGTERFEEAVRLVFDRGQKITYEDRHAQGEVDGVSIELHRISTSMRNGRTAAVYGKYEKQYLKRGYGSVNSMGHGLAVPDPTFHLFFLACHAWGHFMLAGATIMQFSDICLFIEKYRDRIDLGKLEEMLTSIGFMPQWRFFMSVCTDVLGLDPAKAPFFRKAPRWKTGYMISLIFRDAEYEYTGKKAAERNRILRKMHALCLYTGRFARLLPLFPASAVYMYIRFLYRQLSRQLSRPDAGINDSRT